MLGSALHFFSLIMSVLPAAHYLTLVPHASFPGKIGIQELNLAKLPQQKSIEALVLWAGRFRTGGCTRRRSCR